MMRAPPLPAPLMSCPLTQLRVHPARKLPEPARSSR